MLPEYQLQGELVISVPRHRHPRATITVGKGWGRRGGDMLPEYQLQGKLVTFSTEAQAPARDNHRGQGMGHLEVYTHVTGVQRPSAHNTARSPDTRKLLARPPQSNPRGLGRRLGHRSQNRVGSDVASPATVRPWGRWPGSR
jgi:hypothetical protein